MTWYRDPFIRKILGTLVAVGLFAVAELAVKDPARQKAIDGAAALIIGGMWLKSPGDIRPPRLRRRKKEEVAS